MATGRFNGIQAKLERLYDAKSSEEVAEILRKAGAKGYRAAASSCPIANYLNKSLRVTTYEVTKRAMIKFDRRKPWQLTEKRIPLSDPLVAFVREFDKGLWAEFDKERETP